MTPNRIRIFYPPYTVDDVVELSPYGRKYSDGFEFISREERSASGKLRRDIIATKRTFSLSYDTIDDKELDVFTETIRRHSRLPLYLELTHRGQQPEVYAVLINSYSRKRIVVGLWGDVTISFTEV